MGQEPLGSRFFFIESGRPSGEMDERDGQDRWAKSGDRRRRPKASAPKIKKSITGPRALLAAPIPGSWKRREHFYSAAPSIILRRYTLPSPLCHDSRWSTFPFPGGRDAVTGEAGQLPWQRRLGTWYSLPPPPPLPPIHDHDDAATRGRWGVVCYRGLHLLLRDGNHGLKGTTYTPFAVALGCR